ncbi:hypothetical protein P154DRAFT_426732 [Amniculicola lignicola CBS 123094]|uniref:DUF2423 domain-containing protein n=1 Tax=Amniculicola lignicola CBS 123094 TaxID=1392246 RepID=A0A6A5WRP3_9PLEO|nr:hypothetical protein P154DRAFT_426732 [Amniculicola lignicola CBS 123094]
MAKGLRSGIRKAHRTVLRNRVHKPVEDARTQRLHEKLLEVANSAKPDHAKSADEMDVAKADADEKKDADLNGGYSLTAQVPQCLKYQDVPPMSQQETDKENLLERKFYMMLGLSSDIVGFSLQGHLALTRADSEQVEVDMEIDGAAPSSSRPKSSKKKLSKKDTRRRKPRNTISFPATRGKGALKPFSESNERVRRKRYA